MSRWSPRERPRAAAGRPAARARAQTEPLAALVALFAVCAGVSLYATVLGGAAPAVDRDIAEPTLERVREAAAGDDGSIHPDSLAAAVGAGPDATHVNATLSAGRRRWAVGPSAPAGADRAARTVGVYRGPGRVAPGRLTVAVWESSAGTDEAATGAGA